MTTENTETTGNEELVQISAKELADLRSDVDRWKKYSRKHEDDLTELRHTVLVDKIATDSGLPANLKKFLTGKNEEALREQATELASTIASVAPVAETKPAVEETKAEPVQTVEPVVTETAVTKTVVTNPLAGVGSENAIEDPMAALGAEIVGMFSK